MLYFTCCFTLITYDTIPWSDLLTSFNEDNPDDFFVDLKKVIDINDHGNTDINDPCYWSHVCSEREIYGILASVVGNASCPLPIIHHSSSHFGLGELFIRQRYFHIMLKGKLTKRNSQTRGRIDSIFSV